MLLAPRRKIMKAACSTTGFTKLPLEDALRNVRELGFDFVDLLMMENWAHINPSELVSDPVSKAKQVAKMLKTNSLTAVAINGNVSSPLNTSDPEHQEKNQSELEALAIFAEHIGIPIIVLQPGRIDPDRGPENSRYASIDALRGMIKLAKKNGRELTIETHVNSVAEEYEDALKIVEAVPGLKIAYDPSHFVMKELDLAESEPLIDHTVHVHLRNAVAGNFQAAMDSGILDFDWVLGSLKRHNYGGYISIEYIDGRDDYDVKKQILRLKKIIEAA
jgi:sugar phosphate isomerase/epimerase